MHFTAESGHDDGFVERPFVLGDVSGILWTSTHAATTPAPLILLGQQGDLGRMYPRLLPRARSLARAGFATATVELPGSGSRSRIPAFDQARRDVSDVVRRGGRPDEELIERLVIPLVDRAVPEWQATLDALLNVPEIREPAGLSGGNISIAVRMARTDPRIRAASLFAGSFVPRVILEEAREIAVPVHVLLQWDDEGNDRRQALDLFDALGSAQKTLAANTGGHTGVPPWAAEEVGRFFTRHLRDCRDREATGEPVTNPDGE